MRRFGLTLTTLVLLSVPGCSNAPTAPDEAISFDKTYAGHSAGRIVAVGQLREGESKISFSGHVDIGTDGEFRGRWQTHFHSVSVPEFVGRTFVSTEIVGLGFAMSDNPAACIARSNLVVFGTLDGVPGYKARILAADAGKIGGDAFDDFRLVIYDSEDTPLYDTSDFNPARPGGDFPSVSDCNGASRAMLDSGNVQIWLAD
jgi:hypothetical protein